MSKETPSVSPAIESLMEEMIDHRRRVVRQISGVPYAAVKAAGMSMDEANKMGLLADSTSSKSPYDQAQGRQAPSAVGFSKWLSLSRQVAATFRRELLLARSEKKLRKFHHEMVNQASQTMTPSEQDLEFLTSVDERLMHEMVSRGFISRVPEIESLDTSTDAMGPHALLGNSAAGKVRMLSDVLGDVTDTLPDAPESKANVAYAADNVFSSMNHGVKTLDRWFTLFHEAAHCEYAVAAQRFTPSPDKMDAQAAQDMNDWAFGFLGPSSRDTKILLDEANADARAAIMLLEVTNHAPESREVLERWHHRRSLARQQNEAALAQYLSENPGSDPEFLDRYGANDGVLRKVLDSAEQWRGLPPATLKQKASEMASDSVLEFLDIDRKSPDGQPVGLMYSMFVSSQSIQDSRYARALAANLWLGQTGYAPATSEWLSNSDTPALLMTNVKVVQDALAPKFEEVLDSPVPDQYRSETIRTFRDAAALPSDQKPKEELWEKLMGVAHSHVAEPDSPESQAFKKVEAEAARASENIMHALGLSAPRILAHFKPEVPASVPEPEGHAPEEAPSLLDRLPLPSLDRWRARRNPATDSTRPSRAPTPMA